ncbi:hypothetical protein CASFOL_024325 [Castilleja foliolosa]|uniref:Uncharacterized protein n=1 Tax=Castilleja foliolosa TaxID=1961234 RepID=A0ABD3CN06_9LAMI
MVLQKLKDKALKRAGLTQDDVCILSRKEYYRNNKVFA